MIKSGDAGAARAVVRRKLDTVAKLIEQKQWQPHVVRSTRAARSSSSSAIRPRRCITWQNQPQVWPWKTPGSVKVERRGAGLHADRGALQGRPGAPFVAPALLKTAAIEERLSQLDAARQLYQQVSASSTPPPPRQRPRGLSRLNAAGAGK
jgi:hypothetical protein